MTCLTSLSTVSDTNNVCAIVSPATMAAAADTAMTANTAAVSPRISCLSIQGHLNLHSLFGNWQWYGGWYPNQQGSTGVVIPAVTQDTVSERTTKNIFSTKGAIPYYKKENKKVRKLKQTWDLTVPGLSEKYSKK